MLNLTNLNGFLLVACPCLQSISLYFLIYHITALYILYFILRAKDFYKLLYTVPFTLKQLRPWEVCSLNDPWSFAASNSFVHSMHPCTWKSLQFFLIIIIMATFMRVS